MPESAIDRYKAKEGWNKFTKYGEPVQPSIYKIYVDDSYIPVGGKRDVKFEFGSVGCKRLEMDITVSNGFNSPDCKIGMTNAGYWISALDEKDGKTRHVSISVNGSTSFLKDTYLVLTANESDTGYETVTLSNVYIIDNNDKRIDFDNTTAIIKVPCTNSPIELVDLGLSVKWAAQNLDANRESASGGYYAWGETETKSNYTWNNYKYANGTAKTAQYIGSEISQTEYDAAFVNNETLCLPTSEQWQELVEKCTWKQEVVDGVEGYRVTGPSKNSIFLPFSGCSYDNASVGVGTSAFYWTSDDNTSVKYKATATYIKSGNEPEIIAIQRRTGAAIRPVMRNVMKYVDLGLPSGSEWATCNLGSSSASETGNYYAWGETTPKTTYTWNNYKYAKGTAKTATFIGDNICQTNYDAAFVIDDSQNLPTAAQWSELIEHCTWKQETLDGVKGYRVTGPNGNSIFLPFSGCSYDNTNVGVGTSAYYWTADNNSITYKATASYIKSGNNPAIAFIQRRTGAAIRPVKSSVDYVDLGLSSGNLWAKNNLGASSAEQAGTFLAWGETEAKSNYTWNNYEYCNGTAETVKNIGSQISGTVFDASYGDEISVTTSEGTQNFVSCMPTIDDFEELINECTFDNATLNGVMGVTVTGDNGNSIFLPYAGSWYNGKIFDTGTLAYYWTGNVSSTDKQRAQTLCVKNGKGTMTVCRRRTGAFIRPVYVTSGTRANFAQFDIDGITTESTETPQTGDIYTLQGIKVEKALTPGIYIRNGKKFVVK